MSTQTWGLIASIIVAAIAAASAVASQRAAAGASVKNATTASRTQIEEAAFQRAEKYLSDTITRQDDEINDLRKEVGTLRLEVGGLRDDVASRDAQIRTLSAALAARGDDE